MIRAWILNAVKILSCCTCLLATLGVNADDRKEPVVEVTVVKVYGSTHEYLSKVKGVLDVIIKHEPRAKPKVYQAAFAGEDYGLIHISTTYPSFDALAAANPKIVADPEHDRAVEALAAVKREIVSHYMLRDKTPR